MSAARSSTRKRRTGTRLRSTPEELVARAPEAAQPLIERWLIWVQQRFSASVLASAVDDARQGRLISLHLGDAMVTAAVKGGTRPTTVTVQLAALSPSQWRKLIDVLASEAMSEASLLSGELPAGLLEQSELAGAPLAPTEQDPIQISHEPRRGDVEHERAGAVVCLCVLERLVVEPKLMFQLRGLPLETVLERLREQRVMQTQGTAAAHGDPFIAATSTPAPPLDQCLDGFWGSGSALSELEHTPPAQHAPHALLRRMGPSPLGGRFPLVGLLASVYDVVADAARHIRDHAEHIDNNEDPPRQDANT